MKRLTCFMNLDGDCKPLSRIALFDPLPVVTLLVTVMTHLIFTAFPGQLSPRETP